MPAQAAFRFQATGPVRAWTGCLRFGLSCLKFDLEIFKSNRLHHRGGLISEPLAPPQSAQAEQAQYRAG